MTMETVVTQLQQELFTLRVQVRVTNNLATSLVRIDTPTLIDVKGLGRPKEFSGIEEDFQQCRRRRRHSSLE